MKTLNNFDIIKLCQKFEIPFNGIYRRDSIIKVFLIIIIYKSIF